MHHHDVGCTYIKNSPHALIEDNNDLYQRTLKLKEFLLTEDITLPSNKFQKVLLVTHSTVMTALFSEGVDPVSHHFIGSKRFENCEIAPFSLSRDDLLLPDKKIDFSKLIHLPLASPNDHFFKSYA